MKRDHEEESGVKGKKVIILVFLTVTFFTLKINAHGESKRWTDEAKFSFIDTAGNTEVINLSLSNLLNYSFSESFQGALKLGTLYGKSDGEKNVESYEAEFRLEKLFTERFYSSLITGWLKNRFAGIDSRYSFGPAVGYKFLIGPKHYLKSEAKIDYVTEKSYDPNDGIDTDADYFRGSVAGQYEFRFSKKNRFSQSLEYLYDFDDSDNYNLNSVTAFINALSDFLSLQTSYEVKYDHQPVAGLKETDTVLSFALVFNY
ncbi:MAG: YdiY family protein [bacterium]